MAKSPQDKDVEAEMLGRQFEDYVKGKLPAKKAKSVGNELARLLQDPKAAKEYFEGRKRFNDWLNSGQEGG